MIRIIDKRKQQETDKGMTEGQLRTVAQSTVKLLGITLVEARDEIVTLLKEFGETVSKESTDKVLTEALINQLAQNDPAFIKRLAAIIEQVVPALKVDIHDHFSEGGLLEAGKEIGGKTAAGAAGGGIVGAALGLVGGVFGFANTVKQQKIEKDKASAMTLSSMLQYKSAKLQAGGSSGRAKTMIVIVIAMIVVAGLILTVILIRQSKKQAA